MDIRAMTELLQRVSQGDRAAWAQFYETFKREVIACAWRSYTMSTRP
jgi:hypothetical protein